MKPGVVPFGSRLPRRALKSTRTAARELPSFWNCQFTKLEFVLLAVAAFIAAASHLAPVLHSGLGILLTYGLPAVAYLSPVTGFFFIGCNQFIPFPEGSPHNPAQAGVLVWLPVILLRYHRLNLNGAWRLWPVLPFLVWLMVLTGEMVFLPDSEWSKALLYSIIACQLANEAKGQFLKCLVGLSLGALLVMTAYWAFEMGLPVEVSDWGGEREGFARVGSVRADAVMVWPALLLGISGLLGIQIAFASRNSPVQSPKWLTYATLFLSVASMPPLISTMSHGAVAGLAMVVVALIWAGVVAGREGAFGSVRFRLLLKWTGLGLAAVAALFVVDAFQLRTKVISLDQYYKETASETSAAASRTGVWRDSIHTIMKYPILGIRVTGDQEEITSEYASAGGYLSHNIFLDFGRATGIPGMFLLAFFFFWPALQLWRSGTRSAYLPFLLAHFAMFIFWISLSFTFYKSFWGLWMLMAMTVPLGMARRTKVRIVSNARQGRLPLRPASPNKIWQSAGQ
jgi:O-antigen ligase